MPRAAVQSELRSLDQRGERSVDVPLVDAVDIPGLVLDPPPVGVVVPALLAAAQLTLTLPWWGDSGAHTLTKDAVQQKDTASSVANPRSIAH